MKPFQMGPTLKGKNLLQREQTFSEELAPLRREVKMKIAQLLPLRICSNESSSLPFSDDPH